MVDKKKKKKAGEEEDESTLFVRRLYPKICEKNDVKPSPFLKEKLDKAYDDGENLEKIHIWEFMGPVGVRAMMDTFSEIGYKHLKSLRLWKTGASDEGVRSVCIYMKKCRTLEYLDMLDSDISFLGCEFLGKALMPFEDIPLLKLKLDHN